MPRTSPLALALAALLCLPVAAAHADRRHFVQSYTPFTAPAGNLEFEISALSASGQGDSSGTAWKNRLELEYAITDRFTGAAYMNFVQPAEWEAPLRFDGPSLEFIYRFADPGKAAIVPAAYLEVRANGSELELEPKLLLARRDYQLVSVLNVIGEYEHIGAGPERGATEKQLQLTAGASREVGHVLAIGLEVVYTRRFEGDGPDPTSLQLGPTINLQTPRIQLALGWQPQLSGSPATSGRLDLADFPRSEVRIIVGVSL